VTLPRRNRIDLHCHTARSDGVLQPADLLAAMRDWGIALAAITDHDTLDGFREVRRQVAPGAFPRLLPGVEINSIARDIPALWEGELHILGYGMDPDDAAFEAALATQRRLREDRAGLIVERLRGLGMPVDEELPAAMGPGVSSPGRPHIARALVAAGHAESVDDAMRRILARGAPGYVPRQGLGPREAIDAIRAAGGIASLAHFREAAERPEVVTLLRGWGLGGLEAYYVSFDDAERAAVAAVAAANGLLATGGSDFHGDTWTYAEAQAACHVPDAAGEALLAALGQPALRG
jgi:3',5'-nucleoside bisphosphate phosphatase